MTLIWSAFFSEMTECSKRSEFDQSLQLTREESNRINHNRMRARDY